MSKLIRRSDASKLCIDIVNEFLESGEFVHLNEAMAICERFKELPTAEPKRGEWHRSLSDCEEGWVTCNNCGMQFDYYLLDQLGAEIEGVYFTNFCPNCGADMRGKDDE